MNKTITIVQPRPCNAENFVWRSFFLNAVSQLAGCCALLQAGIVYAMPPVRQELPTGAQVVAGSADISQQLSTLNVQQNSDRLVTNWQTFNIGSEATVNFVQPDASSVALNRVLSEGASQIYGRLNSNGQVFLVNPSGVIFSSDSRVEVGGLLASSLDISNEDFLAGNTTFEGTGNGRIINNGSLSAFEGGYIALMAPRVINNGLIDAEGGTAALLAGEKINLVFSDNQLLNMTVDKGVVDALIENNAMIRAVDGAVYMSAKAADTISRSVVNNTGNIEATGIVEKGGRIYLAADGGVVNIANSLNVSSDTAQGGDVIVTGDAITLTGDASIKANGATDGGNVLIGGEWQGSGDLPQATQVTMHAGASIEVNATDNGDGGTVVLWSDVNKEDSVTSVQGDITARGGEYGGNGGEIETSGHRVDTENITVDAGASQGRGGVWLIDPYDYIINVPEASAISSALNSGTDVEVTTTDDDTVYGSLGDNSGSGHIHVSADINKISGGDATLTLKAHTDIQLNRSITSTAGKLNLVLWSDQDGNESGSVSFRNSSDANHIVNIETNGGHLWVGGGGGSTTWIDGLTVGDSAAFNSSGNPNGIRFVNPTSIDTAGGSIYMAGSAASLTEPDIVFGFDSDTTINAGDGKIELVGNTLSFGVNAGSTIETSGELILRPLGGSFDNDFTWAGTLAGSNFSGTDSLAGLTINNVDTLGGLTIGKVGGETSVVIDSAVDVAGTVNLFGAAVLVNADVTASDSVYAYGDDIVVSSNIQADGGDVHLEAVDSVAALDATLQTGGGDVLLKSADYVDLSDTSFQTSGGDITLWSDSDANAEGYIAVDGDSILDSRTLADRLAGTHTSGGGDITFGGGADSDNNGRPDGFATGASDDGVYFGFSTPAATSLYSGGGNILVRGEHTGDANPGEYYGVASFGALIANSGDGSITIEGKSADGPGVAFSLDTSSGVALDLQSSATAGNAVLIDGTTTKPSMNSIAFLDASTKTIQATSGGDIVLSGTGIDKGILFQSTDVLASVGDITIDGNVNGLDIRGSTFGSKAGTEVASSSSDVRLIGDQITFDASSISSVHTTGALTIEPASGSFSSELDLDASKLDVGTTLSSLTLGKDGNTSDVLTHADLVVDGPVSLYGGFIFVNGDIDTTSNTNGEVLLKSTGTIDLDEDDDIRTSGADITLWADSDADGEGNIVFEGLGVLDSRTVADRAAGSHTSGGGDILLAGGLDIDGDQRPDGFAASSTTDAIHFGEAGSIDAFYSGGGDITFRGKTTSTTTELAGINGNGRLEVISGTGRIVMLGESSSDHGITIGQSSTLAPAMDIHSDAPLGTAISIIGITTDATHNGIDIGNEFNSPEPIEATGGGDIEIIGTAAGTGFGIWLGHGVDIVATSGDIRVDGRTGGIFHEHAMYGAAPGTLVTSSTSDITVIGDLILFDTDEETSFTTSGSVSLISSADSFRSVLDLDSSKVHVANTLSELTIGKDGNSSDIYVQGDIEIAGPLSVNGGFIFVNGDIDTTSNTNGEVLLKSTGAIDLDEDDDIRTSGADITLWSDSDADGEGYIVFDGLGILDSRTAADRAAGTHTSGGGDILLAGGLDTDGDGRPDGFAISSTHSGIHLGTTGSEDTFLSGGGDIVMRGRSTATSIARAGVYGSGRVEAISGTGKIIIVGESASGHGVSLGQSHAIEAALEIHSDATSGTAISITGITTDHSSNGIDLGNEFDSPEPIEATGGGDIEIIGDAAGTGYGIFLGHGVEVVASSGDILLDGKTGGIFHEHAAYGAAAGTLVSSSSSDIVLTGDRIVFEIDDESLVSSTGTLTIQPSSDSFSTRLDVDNAKLHAGTSLTGLTIGKEGNTSEIFSHADFDINGPVKMYGGFIFVNGDIDTSSSANGEVLLKSTGTIDLDEDDDITTSGSDITLWSDSDADGEGYIVFDGLGILDSRTAADRAAGTHTSGGGDILLAGGLDTDGDGRPDGFAISSTHSGIHLGTTGSEDTFLSGGGDIVMRGRSTATSIARAGVYGSGRVEAISGTGKIIIVGESASGHGVSLGQSHAIEAALEIHSDATSGTAISITGITTDHSSNGIDLGNEFDSPEPIEATGGGDIEIIGDAAGTGYGIFLGHGVEVVASSGDILLDGKTGGIFHEHAAYGAAAGTLVSSSSSDIVLTGDRIVFEIDDESLVSSTGTLTIQPSSDSFSTRLDVDNAKLHAGTSLTGLTIGKEGNTSEIFSHADFDINGPVKMYGGFIFVNGDIDTSSSANGEVLLKSTGTIDLDEDDDITTSGSDITLWSDSDADGEGYIVFDGLGILDSRTAADRAAGTHTSGGGDILLAGGLDTDGDGRPDGFAISSISDAIHLGEEGSTDAFYSGGGDVTIRGKSTSTTTAFAGINANGRFEVISGTGKIVLLGESASDHGFVVGQGSFLAPAMDLHSNAPSGTAISITGITTHATSNGIDIGNEFSTPEPIEATGGGDIEITGIAAGTGYGVWLGNGVDVVATSGDITVNGGAGGISHEHVEYGTAPGTLVTNSTSDITLIGDRIVFHSGVDSLFKTSGSLSLLSSGNSFRSALDLDSSDVHLGDAISELTLGKDGNSSDVNLHGDFGVNGPLSIHGGFIFLNGNLETTSPGNGDVLVKSAGNIFLGAGDDITTDGSDVTLWSDSNADGNGYISFEGSGRLDSRTAADRVAGTHTSGGGNITLAGGLDNDGDGRPDGFAASSTNDGIHFGTIGSEDAFLSGGGDIVMRGKSTSTTTPLAGLIGVGRFYANSGTGTITILGESANDHGIAMGLTNNIATSLEILSSAPSGTAISIVGTTTSSSSDAIALGNGLISPELIQASGGGDIEIIGDVTGTGFGVWFGRGLQILASSGDITVDGTDGGIFNQEALLGASAGSEVSSSTSDITLRGGRVNFTQPLELDTTGFVKILPHQTSFDSAVLWRSFDPTPASSWSELTIGKMGNTSDVTLGAEQTLNGDINIFGGGINVEASLNSTATNGTITFGSTGTISQLPSSNVTAANLRITTDDGSAGTSLAAVTLQNDGNNVGTIAADVDGFLIYRNAGPLTITNQNNPAITATESIRIETLIGNLTINDSIVTNDASENAVVLNAGRNAAAGTPTGGNIIANNSPNVTVASGGRASLYSGAVDASTGLTSLVQSGSGNFRYNSDEVTSNFTAALGAGVYAIYREQPNVTVSAINETVTYGSALAGVIEYGGLKNGDAIEQVFEIAPILSVTGSTSSSGNYTVGSHDLTMSNPVDQLGYSLSYAVGTLTVNPKTITPTLLADSKIYDGTSSVVSNILGVGLLVDDDASVSGTAAFETKDAGIAKLVNFTGLNIIGADANNYVLDSSSGTTTANISRKNLLLTGITAVDKIYDGNVVAALSVAGATYTGLIPGDDFSLSSVTGEFDTKNVGTDKAVLLSSTYNGADAGNYTIAVQQSVTASITPKDLLISEIAAANKTYDQLKSASVYTDSIVYSGLVAGDVVTLIDSTGVFSDKNVGINKQVTLSNTYGGDDVANYSIIDQVSTTANITQKALTISGLTVQSKVYDGDVVATVDTSAFTMSGLIAGDSVSLDSSAGQFFSKNVGVGKTVTLNNTYSGTDIANYSISDQRFTTGDISRRVLSVSGVTANDRTYDGSVRATLNVANAELVGMVAGDDVRLAAITGEFADANAGESKQVSISSTIRGADRWNYAVNPQDFTTANINQKPLTVTAANHRMLGYGIPYQGGNGVYYDGFVAGESSNTLSGNLVYKGSSQGAVTAGEYSLMPSGLNSTNYELAYVEGSLVIEAGFDPHEDAGSYKKMIEQQSSVRSPPKLSPLDQNNDRETSNTKSLICDTAKVCSLVSGVCVRSEEAACKF